MTDEEYARFKEKFQQPTDPSKAAAGNESV